MARKLIVAGNWKLNGDISLAKEMFPKINSALMTSTNVGCVIFPSYVYLQALAKLSQDINGLDVGSQNVSEHLKGAYTGEVSLPMLKSVGVKHVLLGHSERRSLFNESDELIFKKASIAVEQGFHVTFCVGETLAQREVGRTSDVVAKQLAYVLETPAILEHITIAYEPVWAIGTGQTATPDQAQEVHQFIREKVSSVSTTAAESMHILYGGSVNSGNAAELFAQSDIDGGLVGGASLDTEEFLRVISCTN